MDRETENQNTELITFTVCEACEGEGWTVEPVCCMHSLEPYSCCGDPNWEQVGCFDCEESGVIIH